MTTKSDFAAAEEIKVILEGREKPEQERIMRWVSESLTLASPTTPNLAQLPPTAPVNPPSNQSPMLHPKDIRSFVTEKKPQSENQFATVVAYFYRFIAPESERKETITPKELDAAGRQGRGFGVSNPNVVLNNSVASGYFDRAKRGNFKLNAVGENLVAMALPGTGANGGLTKIRKSKPRRKNKKRATKTS